MLVIEEVQRTEDLERYRDQWRPLVERAPDGSLFQTFEWLTSWLNHFWRNRPIAFQLAWRGSELVAVVPLLPDPQGVLWCRNSLALPVNAHVKRSSPLCADEIEETLDALLGHLRRVRAPFRLGLKQLPSNSRILDALGAASIRHRLTMAVKKSPPSPTITLDGDWDRYLAGRSRHVRSELRRKLRRADQAGLRAVTFASIDECDRALDDIIRIERSSWKDTCGTSFTREAGVAGFYRTLARHCAAAGWLRLHLLYRGDQPLAHIYGVVHKNEYYAIKTSYDEAYQKLSPGAVLFAHAIRDACAQRLTAIDLLGVGSRWKRELSTNVRDQSDVCLFSMQLYRCQACRLHHTHVRPLIERAKPFIEQNAPTLLAAKRRVGQLINLP